MLTFKCRMSVMQILGTQPPIKRASRRMYHAFITREFRQEKGQEEKANVEGKTDGGREKGREKKGCKR